MWAQFIVGNLLNINFCNNSLWTNQEQSLIPFIQKGNPKLMYIFIAIRGKPKYSGIFINRGFDILLLYLERIFSFRSPTQRQIGMYNKRLESTDGEESPPADSREYSTALLTSC